MAAGLRGEQGGGTAWHHRAGLDLKIAEDAMGSQEWAVLTLFVDVPLRNRFLLGRIGEMKAFDLC